MPVLKAAFDDIVFRNPSLAIQDLQPVFDSLTAPAVMLWDVGVSSANFVGFNVNSDILMNTSKRWHERNVLADYFLSLSWQEQVRFGSAWLANYLFTRSVFREMELTGNLNSAMLTEFENWLTINDALRLPDLAHEHLEAPIEIPHDSNSSSSFSSSFVTNTNEAPINRFDYGNSTSSNRSSLFYTRGSRNTEQQHQRQNSYQLRM